MITLIVFNTETVPIYTISIHKLNLLLNLLSNLFYTQNLCLQIFDTPGGTILANKKLSSLSPKNQDF